jgi:hypothetical protein
MTEFCSVPPLPAKERRASPRVLGGSNLDAHFDPKTEVRMLLSFQRPARHLPDGDSVLSDA